MHCGKTSSILDLHLLRICSITAPVVTTRMSLKNVNIPWGYKATKPEGVITNDTIIKINLENDLPRRIKRETNVPRQSQKTDYEILLATAHQK